MNAENVFFKGLVYKLIFECASCTMGVIVWWLFNTHEIKLSLGHKNVIYKGAYCEKVEEIFINASFKPCIIRN